MKTLRMGTAHDTTAEGTESLVQSAPSAGRFA